MSLFESLRPYARLSLAAALETAHLTCDIFVRQIQQQSWHLDVVWDEFCCSLAGDTLSASMAIHCLNALQRLCIHPERPLVLSEQQAMQFFHSVLPKFLHCDLSEIASELRTLLMSLIRSQPSMQPALQHFVLSTVDAMKSQSESLLESDSAALCALLVESSKLFDDSELNSRIVSTSVHFLSVDAALSSSFRALRHDVQNIIIPAFVGTWLHSIADLNAVQRSNLLIMFDQILKPLQSQLRTVIAASLTSPAAILAAAADGSSELANEVSSAAKAIAACSLPEKYSIMCQHYHLLRDRDELDEFVIDMTRLGLQSADQLVAKQSLFLLRARAKHLFAAAGAKATEKGKKRVGKKDKAAKAADHETRDSRGNDGPEQDALVRNDPETPGDWEDARAQVWLNERGQQWQAFFAIWNALQDGEQHLVRSVLPQIRFLIISTETEERMDIWLELLLSRAWKHMDARLRRHALLFILDTDWTPQANQYLNITASLLMGPFVDALIAPSTHGGAQGATICSSAVQFLLKYFRHLDQGQRNSFLRSTIDTLAGITSTRVLFILFEFLHKATPCTAVDPHVLNQLTNIIRSIVLNNDEANRRKFFAQLVPAVCTHMDTSQFDATAVSRFLAIVPIQFLLPYVSDLQKVFNLQNHACVSEMFQSYIAQDSEVDSETLSGAARLGRLLFALPDGSQMQAQVLQSLFSQIQGVASRVYSHHAPIKAVAVLKFLWDDVQSSVAQHMPTSNQSLFAAWRALYPCLCNNLNENISRLSVDVCSLLDSCSSSDNIEMLDLALGLSMHVHNIFASEIKGIHDHLISTLESAIDGLKTITPKPSAAATFMSIISLVGSTSTCISALWNRHASHPEFQLPSALSSSSSICQMLHMLYSISTPPKDVAVVSIEWQAMVDMFGKFQWQALSKLLDFLTILRIDSTISLSSVTIDRPLELPRELATAILKYCVDTLEFVGTSYADSVFRCLRALIPAAALTITHDKVAADVELVSEALDAAWRVCDSFACVGEAGTLPIFHGFTSAITDPILYACPELHQQNGPVHVAVCRLLNRGITRSTRCAHMLAAALMPTLTCRPQLLMNSYAEQVLELCIFTTPEVTNDRSLFGTAADDDDLENFNATPTYLPSSNGDANFVASRSTVFVDPDAEFGSVDVGNAQSCLVRAVALSNLQSALLSGGARGRAVVEFCSYIVLTFLRSDAYLSAASDATPFSPLQSRKCRAWQTICVLAPRGPVLAELDEEVLLKLHDATFAEIVRTNRNETRQFIEVFLTHCLRLRPHQLLPRMLLPALRDQSATYSPLVGCSLLIVLGFLVVSFPASCSLLRDFGPQTLAALLPWLTCNYGQARAPAQFLWTQLYEKYFNIPTTLALPDIEFEIADNVEIVDFEPKMDDTLHLVYQFMVTNPDASKSRRRIAKPFASFSPRRMCSLEGHLGDLGAVAPTFMKLLQDASAQVLSEIKIAHDGADTIPDHDNARGIELLNRLVGTAAPLEDYQQKISILPDELLNNATSVRDQVVGAVRTRKRHDLVVVASLVDRVPNLGGLCRTCEIFNCAKLVVHDKSVVQDPVFTAISVTAHQWLPIEEVRESRVAAYLAEQKRAGYTILALEQTANSQSLEKFKFPSRAVILLGKEREGIPVHLISLVDACIEIPQFGLVRSLNVHVSGAILMWTYVRQHCLEGNAGESAQQVIAALPKLH